MLYWRTTAYSLQGDAVKPVMLRNIAVSGNAAASWRLLVIFSFFNHVNSDNKNTKRQNEEKSKKVKQTTKETTMFLMFQRWFQRSTN